MTKRTRGMLMLLMALLAGVAAVLLAWRWMHAHSKGGVQVAVATVDAEVGAKLTPEMLRLVDWPASSMPPGAYTDLQALHGRVLRTALARGEPVLESRLAPQGAKGGLSAVVAEGKRAMTVRVNDVVGVAGFALPGTFVDIMVNTQSDGSSRADTSEAISKIVLERILVLAVAQEANRDDTRPKVVNAVTLELTPQQAEQLDLARSVGTLSLVLRNQVDPQPGNTGGATKDTLLGLQVQPVVSKEPAAPLPGKATPAVRREAPVHTARACVEVIRGTTRSSECF